MIDGVGDSKIRQAGLARVAAERPAPVSKSEAEVARDRVASPASPAADMAAAGPPVNAEKVEAIRAAIAEGRYSVDADKIAERMIALDLRPAK
jgi:negative regulator of flagellin synthesis FlgM